MNNEYDVLVIGEAALLMWAAVAKVSHSHHPTLHFCYGRASHTGSRGDETS